MLTCIPEIGTHIINFVGQGTVARFIAIRRRKTVKVTNQRVSLMTEILNSIRLIKMYGWESNFSTKIKGMQT